MLYWRNCKLKIIAGIFIVALLGFVILIIVQNTKSSNWFVSLLFYNLKSNTNSYVA